jgi:hypothetical protein
MARISIHLPQKLLLQSPPGGTGFYTRLHLALTEAGHQVSFLRRLSLVAGPDYADDAFHFVHQGLVRQPNALNTGVAYIYPFWYADPWGVFGESSIAARPFDPHLQDAGQAAAFLKRLQSRLIGKRISKYPQPESRQTLPQGAIAVFLQGPSLPVQRAQHMTEPQMLDTILSGAKGRPVLVKPHPRNTDPATLKHLKARAKDHPDLHVVNANIHDMLEAADVTCSVSSSVSLEGMIHQKPAILFGRSDFNHIAQTVVSSYEFSERLDAALSGAQGLPYAAFLHWFLQENCINMGRDDWFDRIQARMDPALR